VFRDRWSKYRPVDLTARLVCGSVAGGIAALIRYECMFKYLTIVSLSDLITVPAVALLKSLWFVYRMILHSLWSNAATTR
jgi:hypothetical protein